MASVVKIKRSSIQGKAPTTGNLQTGELALNLRDQKLFSSNGSVVFEVGANVATSHVGTLTVGNTTPFTLPVADGSTGQYLQTDGTGSVSWASIATGEEAYAFELTNLTVTATNTNPTFAVAQGELSATEVYHNGLKLTTNDYTANSTTVTLSNNPSVGDVIEISVKGYASSKDVTFKSYSYTASANQTIFTGSDDYGIVPEISPASTQVYVNGILLQANVDYIVANTSAIDLSAGTANTDLVTITTISPVSQFVDVSAEIGTSNTTTTGASEHVVDSFGATTYRTAKYVLQITDNENPQYHSSEILLIHDGTNAYLNEYGVVTSNGILGTADADISAGVVRLKVTPTVANTNIKTVRTSVTV